MSKYVECQLDITKQEFIDAAQGLGYTLGSKVKMYKGIYDVEVSADNKCGYKDGKLIFDDMFGGVVASKIVAQVYTDRIRSVFGNQVEIEKTNSYDSIRLVVRR